jgi:hypothetical protein
LKSTILELGLVELERRAKNLTAGTVAYENLQREIEAQKKLISIAKATEVRDASEKAAKEAADEWKKASDQVQQSLSDALMNAFQAGKGFGKTFVDAIKSMFNTMVLRPVISAIVNPVSGAITSALGFSGAANAASGAGGANILSTLQTGFSAINGSISSTISSAFGKFAGSSVGQSLGLSNAQAIAGNNPSAFVPAGGQLTGTGQALGSALGVVGNTLAGYAMGSMARSLISGGYSAGKGMDTFQQVGIAVGSAIGGPLVGAIAGAQAGVVNRLFGRKLKDSGIQGTFGGQSGFEGESYEFYKGGLLRSDKTKTNPLAEEVRKTLGDAFSAMRVEVGTFATALGLETDRLATFTTSIEISTQGLDDKAAQEKIQNALATANNELAEQVIGSWQRTVETISRSVSTNVGGAEGGDFVTSVYDEEVTNSTYTASEFAREGEKAIDTLRRLATSLSTVNGAFDVLGLTLYESSLAGADMASKLADSFGGLENLTAAMSAYYENFYSEQEKFDAKLASLNTRLQEMAAGGAFANSSAEFFRAITEPTRANFRKLAHQHHPDKGGGNEAKFKEVNEAYQVLSDEGRRQKYDQFGENFEQAGGFPGGGQGFEGFQGFGGFNGSADFDIGDIFGDIFGVGQDRQSRRTRGVDLELGLELSFDEAVRLGRLKPLEHKRNRNGLARRVLPVGTRIAHVRKHIGHAAGG